MKGNFVSFNKKEIEELYWLINNMRITSNELEGKLTELFMKYDKKLKNILES